MIARVLLLAALIGGSAPCLPAQVDTWFSSIPTYAPAGTQYYVNAQADVGGSYWGSYNITIWIYKNYMAVAGNTDGNYPPVYASYSSTDYTYGSISYAVEAHDIYYPDQYYDWAYATVTISNPPTISLSYPSYLLTNQSFTITANASDANGDLQSMGVRWQGVGLVGGPWTVSGSSASRTTDSLTAPSTPGSISIRGEVTDATNNSFTMEWVSIPVYIGTTFSFGSVPYNGGQQTVPVTASPSGATYTLSGTSAATNVGTYTATATATGNYKGSYTGQWSITKANQSISFGALSNKTFGDSPFSISATASSGLSVSFSVISGPATISGNTVTITGAGTVTIRASQSGNGNYNAASPVDRSFEVYRRTTTFQFSGGPSFTYDGGTKTVTVTPNPANATYSTSGTWSASAPASYTASVTATGNYQGSGSYSWSILPPPTTYTLSVQNGSGGASGLTQGTQRTITANTPATGMAFDHWTLVSGPGTIANPNASPTTFTVGAGDATVRADYRDVQAPTTPTGLAASSVTSTSFTLTWTASSDNVGVAAYEVRRDSTSLGEAASTSRNVTGLTAATTYQMTVRARDAANNWSGWSSALSVPTPPNAPVATAASNVSASGFTANWNVSTGATSYRLDVSTSSSFSTYVSGYQNLDVGNATTRAVTGLSGSTTYYYRIRAVYAGATSASSNTITTTTSASGPQNDVSNQNELNIHLPTTL